MNRHKTGACTLFSVTALGFYVLFVPPRQNREPSYVHIRDPPWIFQDVVKHAGSASATRIEGTNRHEGPAVSLSVTTVTPALRAPNVPLRDIFSNEADRILRKSDRRFGNSERVFGYQVQGESLVPLHTVNAATKVACRYARVLATEVSSKHIIQGEHGRKKKVVGEKTLEETSSPQRNLASRTASGGRGPRPQRQPTSRSSNDEKRKSEATKSEKNITWGIVFPTHAPTRSRLKIRDRAWASLLDAMRFAKRYAMRTTTGEDIQFAVVVVEDTAKFADGWDLPGVLQFGSNNRRRGNKLYFLKTCAARTGCTMVGDIVDHLKRGYEILDESFRPQMFLNIDSDMLVPEDFFMRVSEDYRTLRTLGRTPTGGRSQKSAPSSTTHLPDGMYDTSYLGPAKTYGGKWIFSRPGPGLTRHRKKRKIGAQSASEQVTRIDYLLLGCYSSRLFRPPYGACYVTDRGSYLNVLAPALATIRKNLQIPPNVSAVHQPADQAKELSNPHTGGERPPVYGRNRTATFFPHTAARMKNDITATFPWDDAVLEQLSFLQHAFWWKPKRFSYTYHLQSLRNSSVHGARRDEAVDFFMGVANERRVREMVFSEGFFGGAEGGKERGGEGSGHAANPKSVSGWAPPPLTSDLPKVSVGAEKKNVALVPAINVGSFVSVDCRGARDSGDDGGGE